LSMAASGAATASIAQLTSIPAKNAISRRPNAGMRR
jgi:hypothetical protein